MVNLRMAHDQHLTRKRKTSNKSTDQPAKIGTWHRQEWPEGSNQTRLAPITSHSSDDRSDVYKCNHWTWLVAWLKYQSTSSNPRSECSCASLMLAAQNHSPRVLATPHLVDENRPGCKQHTISMLKITRKQGDSSFITTWDEAWTKHQTHLS